MGPWTMHRVGRDGTLFFVHIAQPKPHDTIIFMFGEIDVRCHLIRIFQEKNLNIDLSIEDVSMRYLYAIKETRDKVEFPLKICVFGTVPQVDAVVPNPTTPTHGTLQQRTIARNKLNVALKKESEAFGYSYVGFPDCYENSDGSLKMCLSDGHANIAKVHAHHACAAVGRTIGTPLALERPPLAERIYLAVRRYQAIRRRDAATLRRLGQRGGDPRF